MLAQQSVSDSLCIPDEFRAGFRVFRGRRNHTTEECNSGRQGVADAGRQFRRCEMTQAATVDSAGIDTALVGSRENLGPDTADGIAARILGLTFGPGSMLRYYEDQAAARAAKEQDTDASPETEALDEHAEDAGDAGFSAQFIAWVLGEGYAAGRVRPTTPCH